MAVLIKRTKTFRTVVALMLREMATTYGRSPGGYLWAVLEPVAGIALLSLAFGLIFRTPSLGTNFPLFYATGYLPYMFYMDVSRKVMRSIKFSSTLVDFPAGTYLDMILARFFLNAIIHLIVFLVVMCGIFFLFETRTYVVLLPVVSAISMAAALGLSIGILSCYLLTIFPVWERIWTIINRPMFIFSAVFFTYENIPVAYQPILWFNPLVHASGEMRSGFYPIYDATYVSSAYVYGVCLLASTVGLWGLFRHARKVSV